VVSGSTSVSAYGLGVGSLSGLGFILDEALCRAVPGQFGIRRNAERFSRITIEEINWHGVKEAFHLYDPELYALIRTGSLRFKIQS